MLRQITDELMFEIRELTGQEYRNVYAGKGRDPGGRAARPHRARSPRRAWLVVRRAAAPRIA